MDYARLSDQDIERLSGHGRTPEEQRTARRLLRRRRTRERRRHGWSRQAAQAADACRADAWSSPHASPTRTAPTRFDRRALEEMCRKEGWADMPPEQHGDLALFIWCVARGLYDRPGTRQLL